MGIDGSNKLTIIGNSKTLDLIENGGIILSNHEVNNDGNLIYLKENYFNDKSRIKRENPSVKMNGKKTSNKLVIYFDYRNIPPYDYLKLLVNKFKGCWFKNEFITENGDCGLWIGCIKNDNIDIQEYNWIEDIDDYYMNL